MDPLRPLELAWLMVFGLHGGPLWLPVVETSDMSRMSGEENWEHVKAAESTSPSGSREI